METSDAIESKVPGEHTIRRDVIIDTEVDKTAIRDDGVATNSDMTLSPVMTVTKKEATFTKGDLKLQKVTVTEDISMTSIDKNVDESSQSDIELSNEEHQNTRGGEIPNDLRPTEGSTVTNDGETGEHFHNCSTTQPKPRYSSKIPKFKAAVNKIKQNLKTSKCSLHDMKTFRVQESIPVLGENEGPTLETKKYNERKKDQKDNIEIKIESPITDEEFEKIYDEIVKNDNDLLNMKVETHEIDKLEIKFDEIIQTYNENEIQPNVTKKVKSKIPLLKSKSMQEFEILKSEGVNTPRKSSVGRIPILSSINGNSSKTINKKDKITHFTKIPLGDSINKNEESILQLQICENSHYKSSKNKTTPPTASITKIPISQKSNARISSVSLNKQPKRFNLNRNRLIQEYDTNIDLECNKINSSNTFNSNIAQNKQHNVSLRLNLKYNKLKPSQETSSLYDNKHNKIKKKEQTKAAILEPSEKKDIIFEKPESIDIVTKYGCDDPKIILDKALNEIEIKYLIPERKDMALIKNNKDNDTHNTKKIEQRVSHQNENQKQIIYNDSCVSPNRAESKCKVIKHKCIEPSHTIDERNEEDIIILKGKVNRVISRLDSEIASIKNSRDDLSKQSVKSKIYLFENKFQNPQPTSLSYCKSNKYIESDYRPRVIDALLKESKDLGLHEIEEDKIKPFTELKDPTDLRNKDAKEYDSKYKITNLEYNNNKCDYNNEIIIMESVNNMNTATDNKEIINNTHHNSSIDVNITNFELENIMLQENATDAQFSEDDVFVRKCNEIVDAYKMRQEQKIANIEAELKKSRSLAKLDVYDNDKKTKIRTKSIDKMEFRKEVIDSREKPRKGAVSKNIALFESRLVTLQSCMAKSMSSTMSTTPQRIENNARTTTKVTKSDENEYGKFEHMTYINLTHGYKMPSLSLGTALLEPDQTYEIVKRAIELGYRAFDTAYIYGNERQVGEAVREKIADGTVTRDELFIASKLWSTFHRRDLAVAACRHSLETIGLDYFDLFMIHTPMSFKEDLGPVPTIANVLQYSEHDYMDAWYGIEELVRSGLVKLAGVSNFNSEQLLRILEKGKVKPVINQVESHPYLSQIPLGTFCENHDVKLNVYSVLGSKGTPEEFKSSTSSVIDDPLVKLMSAGLGITPAQLLISYQLHLGRSVVVKSSNAERLWTNLQALNIELRPEHVAALNSLNINRRTFTFKGMGDTHKNYPFNIDF